jgi:hypothetical protein
MRATATIDPADPMERVNRLMAQARVADKRQAASISGLVLSGGD